jgi:transcriptional regulator with GAF, ATPase, and Fis domain
MSDPQRASNGLWAHRGSVWRSIIKDVERITDPFARIALLAQMLTAGIDPTELIQVVVSQEMAQLEADGGVFALVGPDGALDPVAVVGTAQANVERAGTMDLDRELPIMVAIRESTPVWVSSREAARERFPDLLAVAPWSHAWAAMPLIANGVVFGALAVTFLAPRSFDESERLFLQALADLSALALAAHAAPLLEPVRDDAVAVDRRHLRAVAGVDRPGASGLGVTDDELIAAVRRGIVGARARLDQPGGR